MPLVQRSMSNVLPLSVMVSSLDASNAMFAAGSGMSRGGEEQLGYSDMMNLQSGASQFSVQQNNLR